MYRCEATSVAGFIQQLAVAYVAHGYWFYVTGEIPAHKDPRAVDAKLIARYGLDVSKWTRCRRRKAGRASVQYLRHGHFFVLVATRGEHEFFAAEASRIRDIRRVPIRYASYAVGCRRFANRWHAAVRLDAEVFHRLKVKFASMALTTHAERLEQAFRRLPVEPYAAVRRQLFELLRAVNRTRQSAGLELIAVSALRLDRHGVKATSYGVAESHSMSETTTSPANRTRSDEDLEASASAELDRSGRSASDDSEFPLTV